MKPFQLSVSRGVVFSTAFAALVLGVWLGPLAWFRPGKTDDGAVSWSTEFPPEGWESKAEPVAPEVRANLGAEVAYSGVLRKEGKATNTVRAFLAVHGSEAIGGSSFLSHTPDRCWPATGWRLEQTQPEQKRIFIQGSEFVFERRIYARGRFRELVYFGAIVGGRPYHGRLDHYMEYAERSSGVSDDTGLLRVVPRIERRAVGWLYSVVRSRIRLDGSAQMLRVSTALTDGGEVAADNFMEGFLKEWPVIKQVRP